MEFFPDYTLTAGTSEGWAKDTQGNQAWYCLVCDLSDQKKWTLGIAASPSVDILTTVIQSRQEGVLREGRFEQAMTEETLNAFIKDQLAEYFSKADIGN